jgi:hypothetical protein
MTLGPSWIFLNRTWISLCTSDAALADVDTELEQLHVNEGCTPTGILPAHPADEVHKSADCTTATNDEPLPETHLVNIGNIVLTTYVGAILHTREVETLPVFTASEAIMDPQPEPFALRGPRT